MGQVLKEQFGVSNFPGIVGGMRLTLLHMQLWEYRGGFFYRNSGIKKNGFDSHRDWFFGRFHSIPFRARLRNICFWGFIYLELLLQVFPCVC